MFAIYNKLNGKEILFFRLEIIKKSLRSNDSIRIPFYVFRVVFQPNMTISVPLIIPLFLGRLKLNTLNTVESNHGARK